MQIYLPIAEISVNILAILAIGCSVGILSGIFGVGGGFLLSPLLIFVGIPPVVAVATQANQVIATSVSGVLNHWSRGNVDFKMGSILLVGGFIGSSFGVWVFSLLRTLGQIDLVIGLLYVFLLGIIGLLMLFESTRDWWRHYSKKTQIIKTIYGLSWGEKLPFKIQFKKSELHISVLLPLIIGALVGFLGAIMGIGGSFLLIPAMIYVLGMPTIMVVGTSLFQIIFVTANVTFLQALANQSVDIFLAIILIIGGVIGVQIGSRLGSKIPSQQLKILLALLILLVCSQLAYGLIATPSDLYSISTIAL
ncbi:MAG: sulfite exporter TauE/SafE family protein [Alphaproteobacteria bacterium]|nr:sulfite exporter TauE/SafE family protein [Alphaproteobacteria bacterium]